MPQKSFPQIEEEILKNWQENKIFQKSLEKEAPKGDYSFYDGPPFATGTPHYGHIVASLMKDVVPRYWTMNGFRVERKWGWDCHGLPIENIVEKEMKIKSKKEIVENIGIERFNDACRSKVLVFADEWKKFIPRMGRWADMEHPYSTMDSDFMESIWWVFKTLYDKKLVYDGHKLMHVCPRCETTLSQSEVSQAYKDVDEPSLVLKFKLLDEKQTYILAWTTTPWTLPANSFLTVGQNIKYVKVQCNNEYYILARDLAPKILEGHEYKIIEEITPKELAGKKYQPLFPYYKDLENAFQVIIFPNVDENEGTGIVHMAPAFGDQEELEFSYQNKIDPIVHITMDGKYKKEVELMAGKVVKKDDQKIIDYLTKSGNIFHAFNYHHAYPHCWRCDTPLINYATSSWFVNVTKIKDQMLNLAEKIHWVPNHIKEGRFGKWLAGAQDWSISRQRFWGSVLPIWKCNQCDGMVVFGSKAELQDRSKTEIIDLHKDKMDKITFPCNKCSGVMQRVPDVLDCWFESGSMPYAQLHYPFANKEKFENNFPADFIAEGVDQTRCWFYYLLVLSVALQKKIPFKNVIANGIVLAADGQKMSKRLKNYPDPQKVIDKYGADALRYYLLISPVMHADTLLFSEKGVDEIYKKVILILNNVLSFYKMYEDKSIKMHDGSQNILDRWIIAKLNLLIKEVTSGMQKYDLVLAARPIAEFIKYLSTWYLRRSRSRFKGDNIDDKQNALATTKYVLHTCSKVIAPFMPFIAEHIYLAIDAQKESVHLESWPEHDQKLIDEKLLQDMEQIYILVEKGLAMREEAKIKIRQPLSKFQISNFPSASSSGPRGKFQNELLQLLKDEINVKEIVISTEFLLDTTITPELKQEGMFRELVRGINALRKKQNLTINDKVVLIWQSDAQEIKQAIQKFQQELQKSTLSEKLEEGVGEHEIKINGLIVKISLKQ